MQNGKFQAQAYQITIETDVTKREQTQHGDPSFPVIVYHDSLRKSTLGYINWHWHPELQYVYVTEGRVRYLVNSSEMILNPGDGLLINSGRLHMAETMPDEHGTYVSLMFHPSILSSFPGSVYNTEYVRPWLENEGIPYSLLRDTVQEDNAINLLFLNVIQAYENTVTDQEIEVLLSLWRAWQAVIHRSVHEIRSIPSTLAMTVMSYISSHLSEPLSLNQISSAAHLSKEECCRRFKQITGETIFTYIKKSRLEYSLNLLRNTDMTISEIAYASGFSTTSYFISTFRSATGTTPGFYRREHRPDTITREISV